ncbi:hypothetical protein PGT21_012099 [Puccinia graminis f. sp. tritici]|uniref:Uncharacterized protein n=1 Tax=Puccinia graminis f. sp. tritici TaxID=56615 RepID=A0A5B0NJJ4_PUCGR|nr:hypothetical protein PGTUg99_029491 [Puccinia graminis f. sp. tritici]KAA1088732.1 hypothetical protein PGTUg99_024267 [Puccinia graminis f. sp. tritici]KAA1088735.1 hypothetical protein PGTUg99_024501 [Puccinia graminis f. sp. tritici]KAA1114521.1 hypothetical protein PGT21_012099 [Puccinia graminis f. sp. tritici]
MSSTLQRPRRFPTLSPRIHQTNTPYPSIEPRMRSPAAPSVNGKSIGSAEHLYRQSSFNSIAVSTVLTDPPSSFIFSSEDAIALWAYSLLPINAKSSLTSL